MRQAWRVRNEGRREEEDKRRKSEGSTIGVVGAVRRTKVILSAAGNEHF